MNCAWEESWSYSESQVPLLLPMQDIQMQYPRHNADKSNKYKLNVGRLVKKVPYDKVHQPQPASKLVLYNDDYMIGYNLVFLLIFFM